MKLSKNFSLSEMTKSSTAKRMDIDNTPNKGEVSNLRSLCQNVLQPIRDNFGRPVVVSSGFRSRSLEIELYRKKVARLLDEGGKILVDEWFKRKSHPKGEAADIEIPGIDNKYLFEWIKNNLEYDQVFLEFYNEGEPDSGWVHVSWRDVDTNRNQSGSIG